MILIGNPINSADNWNLYINKITSKKNLGTSLLGVASCVCCATIDSQKDVPTSPISYLLFFHYR
jgi:hypothetical protein